MNRVNLILNHKLFQEYLSKIKQYEKDRLFCKHDISHLLDVCRIAENLWLQYQIKELKNETYIKDDVCQKEITKELIYATGLLHDIGRWKEYENGIRHEIVSADLAPKILSDCGFVEDEIESIVLAILNHRNKEMKDRDDLSGWIYLADKSSRSCFACEAEELCDWSKEKKNLKLL